MNHRVEITEDYMGRFEIGDLSLEVSPATDLVVRFVDSEFDYLRYLDAENHCMTLHFLGQAALSTLIDFGVPQTRQRLKILQCEYEEYISYKAAYAMYEFEQEVSDIDVDGTD